MFTDCFNRGKATDFCKPLILLFLLSGCKAQYVAQTPLYEEPGWQLWSALPGDVFMEPYEQTISLAWAMKQEPASMPGFKYIDKTDKRDWYGFVIKGNTYWTKDSYIIINYIHDKDTLSAVSEEYLFIEENYIPHFGHDLYSPFPVPNEILRFFSTGHGNPVVFVRFNFLGKRPDILTSATVANVHSNLEEVAR